MRHRLGCLREGLQGCRQEQPIRGSQIHQVLRRGRGDPLLSSQIDLSPQGPQRASQYRTACQRNVQAEGANAEDRL